MTRNSSSGMLLVLAAVYISFSPTMVDGATLVYSFGDRTHSAFLSSSDVPPVIARGTVQLTVTGTVIANAVREEPAVRALESAQVIVAGGLLSAQSAGADGTKPRAGIHLLGSSLLTLLSGKIEGEGSGHNLDRAAILADDDSRVFMHGGMLLAAGSGGQSDRTGIVARGDSQVAVYGGSIVTEGSGDGVRRELLALESATIRIYGSQFNYPWGPIGAAAGTLTGRLADGGLIQWRFSRDVGARIILTVPEPEAWITAIAGVVALGVLRQRRLKPMGSWMCP